MRIAQGDIRVAGYILAELIGNCLADIWLKVINLCHNHNLFG
jgi:hypothetical protein